MKEYVHNRSVQVVLVTIFLIVWGYNLISIIDMSSGEIISRDAPGIQPAMDLDLMYLPEFTPYKYEPGNRDPFVPPGFTSQTVDVIEDVVEERAHPSTIYTLTGIADNMAILHHQDGRILFLNQGDNLDEGVLSDISTDYIMIQAGQQTFTLFIHDEQRHEDF